MYATDIEQEFPEVQEIKPGHLDLLKPSPTLFGRAKTFVVRWLS